MTDGPICQLRHVNGTPVLVIPPLGKKLEKVYGATFVKQNLMWLAPAFHPFGADVLHDLEIIAPEMIIPDEVRAFIDAQAKPPQLRQDFEFVTRPFEHQKEVLQFALHNLRCGIFCDMGLGKTKCVIDLIRHERQRALVLVPVVALGTWVREAAVHSGNTLRVTVVHGTPKAKHEAIERAAAGTDITVVSYDTAKRYEQDIFEKVPYEIIVADESHNLRGTSTDRTKAALALASKAARRIIMSGTPALGNPLHLYGQLAFLGKYIPALNFWKFRKHYLIFAKTNQHMVVGYKNLGNLNEKLQRVSITKKKEGCLDLPPRTVVDVPFSVDREQRRLYNDIVTGTITELASGVLYEPEQAATTIQKLMQIMSGFMILPPPPVCDHCAFVQQCVASGIKPYTPTCREHPERPGRDTERLGSNPKLEALAELLESILVTPSNKVVIWCYFIEELNIVAEYLESNSIEYIRVDGSNSSKAQQFADEFNANPDKRVWLAQVSTGVALTLTAAAYTIYFGMTYRLDHYLQSMDRNYRIGQTQPTFVYRLLVPRSILDFVAQALSAKVDIASTLTTRINCAVCAESTRCMEKGVEPFRPGCLYAGAPKRLITRPQKL